MLDVVKEFMATLANRPNTRANYDRIIDGVRVMLDQALEEGGPERFAERVRAVQQAACEYASPLKSMGLVRQLETFRYAATMDPAEFEVFKHSPSGYQLETLVSRYPVLSEDQIAYVADEYRLLGVSEDSISQRVDTLRESCVLLQLAQAKFGFKRTAEQEVKFLQHLESKEVYSKMLIEQSKDLNQAREDL